MSESTNPATITRHIMPVKIYPNPSSIELTILSIIRSNSSGVYLYDSGRCSMAIIEPVKNMNLKHAMQLFKDVSKFAKAENIMVKPPSTNAIGLIAATKK